MMQPTKGIAPPAAPAAVRARLSKSRFTSGLQCTKMLWWKVHEPDAPQLVAGPEQQVVFDRGNRVGELARAFVPGGVLIDLPHHEIERRVAATAKATSWSGAASGSV